MFRRFRGTSVVAKGAAGLVVGILAAAIPVAGQAPTPYKGQRSPYNDGHPNLDGIWQALNSADWDLEDHEMAPGGFGPGGGAIAAQPPGRSVVEGGTIPYLPGALAQKKKNFEVRRMVDPFNRETLGDPELKCYSVGIPRAVYVPQPFQILQTPRYVTMVYQYAEQYRRIRMGNPTEPPVDSRMGWGNARWDGESLVVHTEGFVSDVVWLDRAGNYASGQMKVDERFTLTGPDHMAYEATITDPKVFSRPWKIQMPLYRLKDANAELLDYRCVPLTEELLYGGLVKKTTGN
jgi:hypothetical protein